jgi:hypothetical protein
MHIFYDIDKLSVQKRKKIINDAFSLKFDWHVDKLDCNESFRRQRIEMSFDDIMIKFKGNCHFTVIHRKNIHDGEYGEVGFCTKDMVTYFLWIFITLKELENLIIKYKLKPLKS